MTGADRGGGLPSPRGHAALRLRGPAHRRSDARARPASLAAAAPLATDVRPSPDPACRHTRASGRGPYRGTRRVIRRRGALADPGVLMLSSTGIDRASSRQADAFVCVSSVAWAPVASHARLSRAGASEASVALGAYAHTARRWSRPPQPARAGGLLDGWRLEIDPGPEDEEHSPTADHASLARRGGSRGRVREARQPVLAHALCEREGQELVLLGGRRESPAGARRQYRARLRGGLVRRRWIDLDLVGAAGAWVREVRHPMRAHAVGGLDRLRVAAGR